METAERAVAEAGTGADHWRRHVKAYRDVVDGRIPYAAADREWRVTREAGPDDVRRFTRAERACEDSAADCEGATQGPATSCPVSHGPARSAGRRPPRR